MPDRADEPLLDSVAVTEMSRAVEALSLELPASVWHDVNLRWEAVLREMREHDHA
jgi:hypothetical protein